MDDVHDCSWANARKGVSLIAAVLVACAALCGCAESNGIERETSDAEVVDRRFEGEPGTDYTYETVTDTRTGVVYLVWMDGQGQFAVGGITPLLDRDGSVTLDPRYTGETEGE